MNQPLDIYELEEQITIERSHPIIGGGSIVSQQSYNIELPLNENNVKQLNIRPPYDNIKSSVNVQVTEHNHNSANSVLNVDKIDFENEKMEATLYLDKVPNDILVNEIRKTIIDSSDTIYPWWTWSYKYNYTDHFPSYNDAFKPYFNGGNTYSFPDGYGDWVEGTDGYDYREKYGAGVFVNWQYHPSCALPTIITKYGQLLEDVGVKLDLGSIDTDYKILATHRKVCPQNEKQWLYYSIDKHTQKADKTITDVYTRVSCSTGGQHICNDYAGGQSEATKITYNRSCTLNITALCFRYLSRTGIQRGSVRLQVYDRDDEAKTEQNYTFVITTDSESTYMTPVSLSWHIDEGDYLVLELHSHYTSRANTGLINLKELKLWLRCEIDGYTITDDDYDTDLVYYSGLMEDADNPFDWACWYNSMKIPVSHYWGETYMPCWSYFGYYTNLGETSFSDILMWLSARYNKFPMFQNGRVYLEDTIQTTTPLLYADLQYIDLLSDYFAKRNTLTFSDYTITLNQIDNANLEDEKAILELPFTLGKSKQFICRLEEPQPTVPAALNGQNFISIDQYSEDGSFNDLDVVIYKDHPQSNSVIRDFKIKDFFLKHVTSPMIYHIRVQGSVSQSVMVATINAATYLVLSKSYNVATAETEMDCLKLEV